MSLLGHNQEPPMTLAGLLDDLAARVARLEVTVRAIIARGCGCCGTDRPEDCGDCSCPEQRRWAELESQTEPTTHA